MSGFIAPNAPAGGNTVSRLVTQMSVRIVESPGRKIDERAIAERRRGGLEELEIADREVIRESVRRTHRHAAVAGDIPGHAQARREIQPLPVHA
jgi:hypothetical protein